MVNSVAKTKRNETKDAWFRSYVGVYNVTRTFRPEILEIAVYFPSEGIELATLRVTPRPHPIIFLDGKSKVGALPVLAVRLDIRECKVGNGASARSSCHFHANVSLCFVSVRADATSNTRVRFVARGRCVYLHVLRSESGNEWYCTHTRAENG